MKKFPSNINRTYGWHKDNPDKRDLLYKVEKILEVQPLVSLPPLVNLRPLSQMPPIVDQLALGSCTANACARALGFIHNAEAFSRLFIYWNERSIEGTVSYDSGGQLRDVISSVDTYGACLETVLPYDITQFTVQPSPICYTDAKADLVTQYLSIGSLQEMKSCLAAGFPFIFGFTVYESFEDPSWSSSTGMMPIPGSNEQVLGGHAVCAVGYDDSQSAMIVANSWGVSWGLSGYFYVPYSFISDTSYADDMWTIRA